MAGSPQAPLGRAEIPSPAPRQFILDSFCVEHQLAIEIDDEVQCNPDQIALDQARSEILATHGIRILRFTNHQVLNKVDDVLNEMQKATTF